MLFFWRCVMQEFILFVMTFTSLFLIYQIFIVRVAKRRNSSKKPMEVKYLEARYKIDLKVIDYKKLLLVISIVSSFDIALLVSLVSMIHSYILEIVIALFLIIPLILISYHIIGIYYVKKGLIKDV